MTPSNRARADEAPDDVDGVPVAVELAIRMVGVVAASIGWLWLMHIAGQGRMPW